MSQERDEARVISDFLNITLQWALLLKMTKL